MSEWFYAIGPSQHGPVSADQIAALVASGTLDGNTLVWSAPMPSWQPLAQTPLSAALQAPRPPIPGMAPGPVPAAYGAPASAAPADAFRDAIRSLWANYARFEGRADRPQFWYAALFMVLVSIATSLVDLAIVGGSATIQPLSTIATLAFIIPSISVAVRRLHDTDRSGWWYLIMLVPLVGFIVLIVFWCQRGTPGANRFG